MALQTTNSDKQYTCVCGYSNIFVELYKTMLVTPKVTAFFLSKLKTHYINLAFYYHNHLLVVLFNFYFTLYGASEALSYGWWAP